MKALFLKAVVSWRLKRKNGKAKIRNRLEEQGQRIIIRGEADDQFV